LTEIFKFLRYTIRQEERFLEESWPSSLIVPKLDYKYLNSQNIVIKVY